MKQPILFRTILPLAALALTPVLLAGEEVWSLGQTEFSFSGPAALGYSVVTLDDVSGDGIRDLAVSYAGTGGTALPFGSIRIVSGRDGATLRDIRGDASLGRIGFNLIDAGDIDGDGLRDVASLADAGVVFFSSRTGAVLRSVPLTALQNLSASIQREVVLPGDVDGDGFVDILVGDPQQQSIGSTVISSGPGFAALLSGRDGSILRSMTPANGLGYGQTVSSLGDLDLDGVEDYAVTGAQGKPQLISGQTGLRIRVLPVQSGGRRFNELVRVGDLDGDGLDDVALTDFRFVRAFSSADDSALFAVRHGGIESETRLAGGPIASLGDVDGDGSEDIVLATPRLQGALVRVLSGADGATLTSYTLVTQPASIGGLGDVNGDLIPEFWVGYGGLVEVYSALERVPQPTSFCYEWANGTFLQLSSSGSTSVAASDLDFIVQAPAQWSGTPLVLIYAPERGLEDIGSTTLCLGGPLRRVAVGALDAAGLWSVRPDLGSLQIQPGSSWSFQALSLFGAFGTPNFSSNGLRASFGN